MELEGKVAFLTGAATGIGRATAELFARAGAVAALFVAMLGGLAWAGHDVITIDGGSLGLDSLPGGGLPDEVDVPGLVDIGGLLPDRLGDLAAGCSASWRSRCWPHAALRCRAA